MLRLFLLLSVFCSGVWAESANEYLRQFHERILQGEQVMIQGEPVVAEGIVPLFYQQRNYQPAWDDKDYALSVLELLRRSDDEGLYKEDYHYAALSELIKQFEAGEDNRHYLRAQFDLLLTDGLLLYALHLRDGKVDASELIKTWNYESPELLPEEVIELLNRHIEEQAVAEGLASLLPPVPHYAMIKQGLARFQQLANERPFEPVLPTKTLRPGDESEALVLLRQRLVDLKLLDENSESPVYDAELESAVKAFQRRHGLEADGVVGPASFTALNVSYHERADQLRINLDRIRWVANDLSSDFILVNLGGFDLRLVRDGEQIWQTDVMTGAVNTKTPIFKSEMTYLVFNPTWTVPRGILGRTIIPQLKADPTAAARNRYQLFDRDGREVDPLTLDWSTLNRNHFPYTVVQAPFENNAMGQVKFMFPNQYAIYLHDTPSKNLFRKSERAFSNGCIRVKDPMTLARLLLNDEGRWNDEAIATTVAGRRLQNVTLSQPIDVLLMYWTVRLDENGEIGFVRDIYNRDAEEIEAFKRPLF